jgi:hypothetical protein
MQAMKVMMNMKPKGQALVFWRVNSGFNVIVGRFLSFVKFIYNLRVICYYLNAVARNIAIHTDFFFIDFGFQEAFVQLSKNRSLVLHHVFSRTSKFCRFITEFLSMLECFGYEDEKENRRY